MIHFIIYLDSQRAFADWETYKVAELSWKRKKNIQLINSNLLKGIEGKKRKKSS